VTCGENVGQHAGLYLDSEGRAGQELIRMDKDYSTSSMVRVSVLLC
jgi:hypothetical protein